jgi:hypothetical protein
MNPENGRLSSSGSMIYYPETPKTFIYPSRQNTTSTTPEASSSPQENRPSSFGTVIFYPDAPPTIIYPPRGHYRSPQSAHADTGSSTVDLFSGARTKRKRRDATPSDVQGSENSGPNTFGLVVLLQRDNLAMAIDFAAFKKEFDAQGIKAEYRSVYDLEELIEKQGKLIYGRDDIAGWPKQVVLEKGREKFYSIQPQPRKIEEDILLWVRTVISAAERNDNILLVLISHGTGRGSIVIRGEQLADEVDYLASLEIKSTVSNLGSRACFFLRRKPDKNFDFDCNWSPPRNHIRQIHSVQLYILHSSYCIVTTVYSWCSF